MKEFCILGKLSTKYYAPFDNENITIISMNAHNDECMIPRVDYWFDLHHNPEKENADYTIDNFPFEECHKLMGRRFCTTMSYLIAWCILQGATKIYLYGSRFTLDGNPRRERELHNVREWICYCLGKGIEIEIYDEDKPYLFPEHIVDENEDFDQ